MYHLIPLTFLIYAFSTLFFSSLGGKDPLVWVGLVLSAIFVTFISPSVT